MWLRNQLLVLNVIPLFPQELLRYWRILVKMYQSYLQNLDLTLLPTPLWCSHLRNLIKEEKRRKSKSPKESVSSVGTTRQDDMEDKTPTGLDDETIARYLRDYLMRVSDHIQTLIKRGYTVTKANGEWIPLSHNP